MTEPPIQSSPRPLAEAASSAAAPVQAPGTSVPASGAAADAPGASGPVASVSASGATVAGTGASTLAGLDHVVIAVTDLDRAASEWAALGFTLLGALLSAAPA